MVLGKKKSKLQNPDDHRTTSQSRSRHARRISGPARARGDRKLHLRLELLFDRRGLAAHRLSGLRRGKLAQYGFHLEVLDHVIGLDVVEVLESDAAFVTGLDFARVVLEALERTDFAVPYDPPVAHQARPRTALNLAVRDHRAADRGPLHHEGLTHLRSPKRLLAIGRCKQPLHRFADIVYRLVDNRVEANLDAFLFRELRGLLFGPHIKAEDNRLGGRGQRDVGFRNRADGSMNQVELDFVGRKPLQRIGERLDRAVHVALDNDAQLLHLTRRHLLAQVFERDAAGLLQYTLALLRTPELGDLTRLRLFGHPDKRRTGLRYRREPENLDRRRRSGLGQTLPEMVQHRAYASERGAAHKRIALMECAFLDQHRRHGTAAAIQLGFDYRAARGAIRIGPEIHHVRLQQNHFEQPLDPFAAARGNRHRDRFAAVILGNQPLLAELLLDAIDVGLGPVDLVYRNYNRDFSRLRVIDRLDRLRHHTLVRRDDQDHEIGDLGAARAHSSERLMAGRIDEADLAPVNIDHVGADMLRDTAGFLRGDVGMADSVEQRSLAVVDMAHHGHDRRTGLGLTLGRLFILLDRGVDVEADILDGVAEVAGNKRRRIDVEHLVERRHRTEVHQLSYKLAGLDPHIAREVGNGDAFRDTNNALGCAWRRDFGLSLFLAGKRAALLGDPHAAHLALGHNVRRALLDDTLLLDPVRAGLGLLSRWRTERVGWRSRGRRRRTGALHGAPTRTRAHRRGRRWPRNRRFAEIDLAEHLGPARAVVERRC